MHAPAAALHARRSTPQGVSVRLQQLVSNMAKMQRWRRAHDVWTAWMRDRTASAPPPARPSPLPLLRPPPRLRRRRPAAPTCACALPLAQRRSASTRRTPEPPRRLPPPPRARPRRKGASWGVARSVNSRQPHRSSALGYACPPLQRCTAGCTVRAPLKRRRLNPQRAERGRLPRAMPMGGLSTAPRTPLFYPGGRHPCQLPCPRRRRRRP